MGTLGQIVGFNKPIYLGFSILLALMYLGSWNYDIPLLGLLAGFAYMFGKSLLSFYYGPTTVQGSGRMLNKTRSITVQSAC